MRLIVEHPIFPLTIPLQLLARRNKALWMKLQRGYMVQSQFDSPHPSSYAVNTYSTPYTPRLTTEHLPRTAPRPINTAPEMVPLHSPVSLYSRQSAAVSSLVAENGSQISPVRQLKVGYLLFSELDNIAAEQRGGRLAHYPVGRTGQEAQRCSQRTPWT